MKVSDKLELILKTLAIVLDWEITFMVQVKYDKKADALYIAFRKTTADISAEAAQNVIIDLDKAGHIIGIEVLDASKNMGQELVTKIIDTGKL